MRLHKPPKSSLSRPVRTRFRYGSPTRVNLATHHNSQAHSSKGTPSHHTHTNAGDALTACRHTVSGTISRPLTGVLFTFPSRYSSAIGHQGVFRLTRWSWQIHTRFHEPRATREHRPTKTHRFRLPGSHRLRPPIPECSTTHTFYNSAPPRRWKVSHAPQHHTRNTRRLSTRAWFSLIPFRSPLLRESQLFSLPTGTEMFHFPALPSHTL